MDRLGLSGSGLVTVYQTHSAAVHVVETVPGEPPRADAMVSRTQGVALGILTADCAPVLFADSGAGVIGAAHAGWRGAKAGILEATIRAMMELGAQAGAIRAAIGPCIAFKSYEVGAEFEAAFSDDDGNDADLFGPADREGHYRFDLPRYVARRLSRLIPGAVEILSYDTCSDATRFFSYRRTCLEGGTEYGRCLSAIALED
jgi:YfiH family protein